MAVSISRSYKSLKFYLKCEMHRYKRNLNTSIKKYNNFTDIPGPLSLPGIGTLYQYLPLMGM